MAAVAPVLGPAATQTYTLDYNAGNEVVINGVAGIDALSKRPLGALYDLSGNPYNNVLNLIEDQKTWNYLDALKDGTNKHQLDALNIYEGINLSFSALHPHENRQLNRNKSRIFRTTWLKTKKNSKMNLINVEDVFWEAGLGYESFIQAPGGKAKEVVTFGSYIDPLTKPGKIWPPPNYKIYITPSFMNAFGFGPSSLWAISRREDLVTKSSGNAFHYEININCGMGCGENPNTCKLEHDPATASRDPKGNIIDKNNVYFKGNESKNTLVNTKVGNGSITSADKTKLIVAKGWGDKVQVMLYYMYYYIKNKNSIMITCDLVVFCFCMTLDIPCVYTGVYDRDVGIHYNERNDLSLGGSFFSILHFKPGTPMDNAVMNYRNTIDIIMAENEEFIINISTLIKNYNTGIEVGGSNPMTFQEVFYRGLYEDMTKINRLLNDEKGLMPGNIDDIINKTQELKKIYLIVPMFKYTGRDKIRFLQTKWYTSDKNITLNNTTIGSVKKNNTFLQFAKTNHNSKYGTNPNPVPVRGGGNKEDMIKYRIQQEQDKHLKWVHDIARAKRVVARAVERDKGLVENAAYKRYNSNNSLKLDEDGKKQFPRRDDEPKFFRSCPGDMNDISAEYTDEHGHLFLFDDQDDSVDDHNRLINKGIDFQYIFDVRMLAAIDEINDIHDYKAEYAASHENVNQKRNLNIKGGRRRNATRRQQKGGGVDETLFETLYTLYVYRAQYDIELDTPDHSINMKVLTELYEDYPKSEIQPNRNNTRSRVKGAPVTGPRTLTYTIPVSQVTGGPVKGGPTTGSLATGMSLSNRRKQAIYEQTRTRNNSPNITSLYGGRITRRKKRFNRRTRK